MRKISVVRVALQLLLALLGEWLCEKIETEEMRNRRMARQRMARLQWSLAIMAHNIGLAFQDMGRVVAETAQAITNAWTQAMPKPELQASFTADPRPAMEDLDRAKAMVEEMELGRIRFTGADYDRIDAALAEIAEEARRLDGEPLPHRVLLEQCARCGERLEDLWRYCHACGHWAEGAMACDCKQCFGRRIPLPGSGPTK